VKLDLPPPRFQPGDTAVVCQRFDPFEDHTVHIDEIRPIETWRSPLDPSYQVSVVYQGRFISIPVDDSTLHGSK
jgi:hypothetical protein